MGGLIGYRHTDEAKRKISESHQGLKRPPRSDQWRERQRIARIGRVYAKGWKRGPMSEEHKKKLSDAHKGYVRSTEHRRKLGESRKGEKSHFWRGGVSTQNELARKSLEYDIWRDDVFKRDNWTCKDCGTRGGELHADHIQPWSIFPELRFVVSNGRTLCKPCHEKTPTYGGKMLKYKEELLANA